MFQILKTEFIDFPYLDVWRERLGEIIQVDNWKDIDKNIPTICSGNLKYDNVRHWLKHKFPVLYVARGYVGNHLYKHRNFWRISANGWANIELKKIPHSRWSIMGLEKHPWKVKSVKNILIAPSKMTTHIWTNQSQTVWADSIKKSFKNCNVKIRLKDKTPKARWNTLWNDFDWADLIVGQSSAITAEAFWYGKKVISTHPCITWAAAEQRINDWQDPIESKNRDIWHEHLAWSQFTTKEWQSGKAIELSLKYHGDLKKLNHPHYYSF